MFDRHFAPYSLNCLFSVSGDVFFCFAFSQIFFLSLRFFFQEVRGCRSRFFFLQQTEKKGMHSKRNGSIVISQKLKKESCSSGDKKKWCRLLSFC